MDILKKDKSMDKPTKSFVEAKILQLINEYTVPAV
jgi:hypothetical protein